MNVISTVPLRIRRALLALGTGVLYGGWALFANHDAGTMAMLRAAGAQLAMSTATSLVLQLQIEGLFHRARTPERGFWLASTGTAALAAAAVAAGHAVLGTPHIARTIAPSVIIGTVFCFGYAGTLLAAHLRTQRSKQSLA